jgi:NAD(P)-dependent dehydrogenase (short-subunit alcohol dehydrogenase family)
MTPSGCSRGRLPSPPRFCRHGPAPVRVNAVTPDLIDTPLLHTAYGEERDTIVQNRAAILPGRRVGTADEVAQVILMLMTNDYVTGEVVHVDGGGRFVYHCSSNSVHD